MCPRYTSRGLTLTELMVTLAVIGIAAAVALPSLDRGTDERSMPIIDALSLAAYFARESAREAGRPYGIELDVADNTLRVFRVDDSGVATFDVRHPISRQPYEIVFGVGPYAGAVLTGPVAAFNGVCANTERILVNPEGAARCADSPGVRAESVTLGASYAGRVIGIRMHPITGRVLK